MPAAADTYIGLMSGTSADGVDGVLAQWSPQQPVRVLAHVHEPYDSGLRERLLALNQPAPNELQLAAECAVAVAQAYARVTHFLLQSTGSSPDQVRALGAHGQTVRHQPPRPAGPPGYTLQLLNGALLAELTGIDVVCDLRSRDLAAGGQGAPLVPALHHELFARPDAEVAVLNIGGIANLSLLPALHGTGSPPVLGFDCGPGNALMDSWCGQHLGTRFDEGGQWARSGHVDTALLQHMLAEPYFALPPPKSTGRDLFDQPWLDTQLNRRSNHGPAPRAQDVQATLAELTAQTAAEALLRQRPACQQLLVCGGGAYNAHLMTRLAHHLPRLRVQTTADAGVPVDQVEALAFAWLARAWFERMPGNLPSVTGAAGPRTLGALYPGR